MLHFYIALYYPQREGILRDLIMNGADVNTSDLAGNTPLHVAVYAGITKFVDILVETGQAHPATSNRWTRLVFKMLPYIYQV